MDIAGRETLAMQEYCPPLDVYNGLNWRMRVVVFAETTPEVSKILFATATFTSFLYHIT